MPLNRSPYAQLDGAQIRQIEDLEQSLGHEHPGLVLIAYAGHMNQGFSAHAAAVAESHNLSAQNTADPANRPM